MKAKSMKKTLSVFLSLFFALAVFAGGFLPVAAAGTSQISFSKNQVTVGDSFTVSVKASESSSITLKFSSSVVTLTDAGGGSASGNGVSFSGTKITCRFTAAAAGKADFIVSSSDGAVTGSSASLTVAAAEAPAETPAETPETPAETPAETPEAPAETPAETPASTETPDAGTTDGAAAAPANADLQFNGVWYAVSERYSDSQIPAGFSKTMVSVGAKNVQELTNGTYTLVYLKSVADDGTIADTGSFFFYDTASGAVSGPVEMIGSPSAYVIAVDPAENPYANVLTQASFDFTNESGTVTVDKAYVLKGSGEGYYYLYGFRQDGTTGWYCYSAADGTVQTADVTLLSNIASGNAAGDAEADENPDEPAAPQEGSTARNIKILKVVLVIVIALVVLLIVLNMLPKNRRDGEEDDDGADGYDDSDFEEPGVLKDDDDGEEDDEISLLGRRKNRARAAAEKKQRREAEAQEPGKKTPESSDGAAGEPDRKAEKDGKTDKYAAGSQKASAADGGRKAAKKSQKQSVREPVPAEDMEAVPEKTENVLTEATTVLPSKAVSEMLKSREVPEGATIDLGPAMRAAEAAGAMNRNDDAARPSADQIVRSMAEADTSEAPETKETAETEEAPRTSEAPETEEMPRTEETPASNQEEGKSRLDWARRNFWKTGKMPEDADLFYGDGNADTSSRSGNTGETKGKKGGKKNGGSGSGDGSGGEGGDLQVIDFNDL